MESYFRPWSRLSLTNHFIQSFIPLHHFIRSSVHQFISSSLHQIIRSSVSRALALTPIKCEYGCPIEELTNLGFMMIKSSKVKPIRLKMNPSPSPVNHRSVLAHRLNEFPIDSINRVLAEKILTATRYGELPNRLILKSPFCDKPLISYGVIPYCQATQRWLLVKRRHSPEEIIMMRGSYRNAEIPRLLEGKSKTELAKDRATLADPSQFTSRFNATIGTNSRDLNYAINRFIEAKTIIANCLETTSGQVDTEWLFPKGRILAATEEPHTCALREFHEESGIRIQQSDGDPSIELRLLRGPSESNQPTVVGTSSPPIIGTPGQSESPLSSLELIDPNLEPPSLSQSMDSIIGNAYLISDRPLVDSFRATNGRVYETRCWIYVFPTEVQPPPVTQLDTPGEIGDRRWVTQAEAQELLSPQKYQILKNAASLITEYLKKSRDSSVRPSPPRSTGRPPSTEYQNSSNVTISETSGISGINDDSVRRPNDSPTELLIHDGVSTCEELAGL
jgi:8-oxo-dGTP pyrophosphatase MutT (NUDIX family)